MALDIISIVLLAKVCKYWKEDPLNNQKLYSQQAEFCKLMANPKRLEIIALISDQALCVEQIAQIMAVRVPNISQHLAMLRDKGVVKVTREGTRLYYKLTDPHLMEACNQMRQAVISHMREDARLLKNIEDET